MLLLLALCYPLTTQNIIILRFIKHDCEQFSSNRQANNVLWGEENGTQDLAATK